MSESIRVVINGINFFLLSHQIKFLDYNFTSPNVLNLNWLLYINKTLDLHSLIIFEGSNIRSRLDRSTVRNEIKFEFFFHN